jgi:hypothetical protein
MEACSLMIDEGLKVSKNDLTNSNSINIEILESPINRYYCCYSIRAYHLSVSISSFVLFCSSLKMQPPQIKTLRSLTLTSHVSVEPGKGRNYQINFETFEWF